MRTGLRDSALRRVRSVAAGQRGEMPVREGTARGGQGRGPCGTGVPAEKGSPWDGHASPGHLPRVPWVPASDAKGLTVSLAPGSFPLRSVNPNRVGGSSPLHSSCPRGKTHWFKAEHPRGVQCPQRAFPALMGSGGQEWDRITLHCGTTGGSSHDVPELLPQPCLSCSSVQGGGEGGRRHGAGGTSPAFPSPPLPSILMIWFNLFFTFCRAWSGWSPRGVRET